MIYSRLRKVSYPDLTYRHHAAYAEPLLAIPDAIAWCVQRGGQWSKLVRDIVTVVKV
jgi:hypothetical protein